MNLEHNAYTVAASRHVTCLWNLLTLMFQNIKVPFDYIFIGRTSVTTYTFFAFEYNTLRCSNDDISFSLARGNKPSQVLEHHLLCKQLSEIKVFPGAGTTDSLCI